MPYRSAIGSSYTEFPQNWGMPKTKERTFLDRAMEALRDRYPKDRPTQVRLAKIAGVTQPTVHEWGFPDRAPDYPQVKRLAEELGVCVEWLYMERGPKHPPQVAETEQFLLGWSGLDETKKRQIAEFADFLKGKTSQ